LEFVEEIPQVMESEKQIMTLKQLLSLSYPMDEKNQQVFEQRVLRFFSYSTSNMMTLIFGAGLIALVLHIHDAESGLIKIHFLVTSALAIALIIISRHVIKNTPVTHKLAQFLQLRVFLGCAIGFMFAIATLLLPEENTAHGILFLLPIYIVSVSIAIFQYSVIPAYYIAFNISIFIPLIVIIMGQPNPNETSLMTIVLLLSGAVIYISKGLKVSKNEINLIVLNSKLKSEIDEHIITRQKLTEMALYDNLTKVANRYLFEDSAKKSILRARDSGQRIALLYIDLNRFKKINDCFGHDIGDKVLVEVAQRIRANIRSCDFVARLGGDEFVVILENFNLNNINVDLAEAIRFSLNEDIVIDGNIVELRASIGTSIFPQDGDDVITLLNKADSEMYVQKKSIKRIR
jgi:diguanylate cyclase (GGDEF)-like protein